MCYLILTGVRSGHTQEVKYFTDFDSYITDQITSYQTCAKFDGGGADIRHEQRTASHVSQVMMHQEEFTGL